jgi:hypothetical protein
MALLYVFFRIAVIIALGLGLADLFSGVPTTSAVVTVHVVAGVAAVLLAWRLVGPLVLKSDGLATGAIVTAAVLLALGVGLLLQWWSGLTAGIIHLGVALAMMGFVETAHGRAQYRRRVAAAQQRNDTDSS